MWRRRVFGRLGGGGEGERELLGNELKGTPSEVASLTYQQNVKKKKKKKIAEEETFGRL